MTTLARRALASRALPVNPLDAWAFQTNQYPTGAQSVAGQSPRRESGAASNYTRMFTDAMAVSGPVFACMLARRALFSEARFIWQRMPKGRPGTLFGSPELAVLETPWTNGTTGGLLARMIDHEGLAGNAFVAKRIRSYTRQAWLKMMRPDWVTIVMGSYDDPGLDAQDLDAEVIGYIYRPGGPLSGREAVALTVDDVAHFAPNPDPLAFWRGMSWLTPVLREIGADAAATDHKARFFENGATPQMVVSFDKEIKEEHVRAFAQKMTALTTGTGNAYKTIYLGGGADVTVVGKDLQQLDFSNTQGKGETRIAAASGIHPAVLGLSEGLQGASLNAGNFGAARRLTGDKTLRPLWREACYALSTIIDKPQTADPSTGQTPVRLWIDDRDIPFLREDIKDIADAQLVRATAIESLVRSGFTPESAVKAVDADDFTLLDHTGLVSVQLQKPGEKTGDGPPGGGPPGIPPQIPGMKPGVPGMPGFPPKPPTGRGNGDGASAGRGGNPLGRRRHAGTPAGDVLVRYSDDQARDDHGRWEAGGGGSGLEPATGTPSANVTLITRDSLSNPDTPRTREVSASEFRKLAAEGKTKLDGYRQAASPPTGLDRNFAKVTDQAWQSVQSEWGGVTVDSHTGTALAGDENKFALTVKPAGMDSVSVPTGSSRAAFDTAMGTARQQFASELSNQNHYLGVFRDDDNHRIDIDPVLVVDKLHDVETIGAYTHAVGGAYNFADGDGYWPPYVAGKAA